MKWLSAFCKVASVVALGIGLCALLGHVVDRPAFYTWGGAGSMSRPTAVFAILLSMVSLALSYEMAKLETEIAKVKRTRGKKLARS